MANMQIVPACKDVEAQYVELMVPLYSYGCEKKIRKTLSHLKGIYSVNVDHLQQKVTVWGICNKYDVLETVKSKRKGARFWNQEDNDNVVMDQKSQPPTSPPPPSSPQLNKDYMYGSSSKKPYLTLIRAQSLSWKAWKKLKVFNRSYSF